MPGQIGLEATPAAYVARMVEVFREVRRVLREDGVCWLNLGDSYAIDGGPVSKPGASSQLATSQAHDTRKTTQRADDAGLKPKDLIGIPWRVAFALQADGWWLRSAITWCKGNPMPESVRDRPTKATEMIFMLTKSARYFFDADAVREGVGETGVVMTSDLQSKSRIFGQDFGPKKAPPQKANVSVSPLDWHANILQLSVSLASSILDLAQRQNQLGLPALDSQIRHEGSRNGTGARPVSIPVIGRASAQASRFTDGDISAKEFLGKIDSLCVTLSDGDDLKELWAKARIAAAAPIHLVNSDSDTSIGVNHTSQVSQLQFVHGNTSNQEYTIETTYSSSGRNLRDWWVMNTHGFKEAHFATFPEELPRRCIMAGTSAHGCCPECGAPWVRETERTAMVIDHSNNHPPELRTRTSGTMISPPSCVTTGWRLTCDHDAAPIPCTVLDPFAGSGTTLAVALALGRNAIGIDLNPEYVKLAERRLAGVTPALFGV